MLNWFRSYFSFTKKELNGILVLLFLIAVVAVYPLIYSLFQEQKSYDFSRFAAEVDRFYASEKKKPAVTYERDGDSELIASYFEFDPNGLSENDWKKLGMSVGQIRVIKNYELKGGRFYRKEDLKKIYSISAQKYALLEPYIKIENSRIASPFEKISQAKSDGLIHKPATKVDLNTADSIELEGLKGIGPTFALRIIKYRDKLGGFHSIDQLREVYGIDSVKFNQFKHQVTADPETVVKIDINKADFNSLRRHPYLTYKQMNAILQYRKQHGPYSSIDDLRMIKILNDEILRKIAPYFSF